MSHTHQFQFFDIELVKTDDKKHNMFHDLAVLCWSSGRSQLAFGTHEGYVRLYDRSFQCQEFKAYKGPVFHIHVLRNIKYIVTVGDDGDEEQSLVCKVWCQEREGEDPVLRKEIRLFTIAYPAPEGERLHLNLNPAIDLDYVTSTPDGSDTFTKKQSEFLCPVTYMAVTDDLSLVALGLSNGDVILVHGAVGREKLRQVPLRRTKEVVSGSKKVTYLAFKKHFREGRQGGGYQYTLLVLNEQDATAWDINERSETAKDASEMIGCRHGNACLDQSGKVIIAEESSIKYYGGSHVADTEPAGVKSPIPNCSYKMIGVFKDYTYMVVTVDRSEKDQLVVYDFPNKLRATVSHQCFFPNIVCVLSEWNSLFVLCQEMVPGQNTVNQKFLQLEEKDTQTKLDLLFQNSHFPHAIDMAKNQQYDTAAVTEIHKKYGDYLYGRTDYEQAVQQYALTIGFLEPSYVIRKFLDAQQILHLTTYLDKLHTARDPHGRSWANEDHTTLLLNCYTKLKDKKKLEDFIERERDYNPDMAIIVCRQSQYYEEAVDIAKKFEKHSAFLSIQVEDLRQYDRALRYIHSLKLQDATEQLRAYGKTLVSRKPTRATELITEICTGWKPQPYDGSTPPAEPVVAGLAEKAKPQEFLHCFVDMPLFLLRFLEAVKNELELAEGEDTTGRSSTVYNTLLELYLTQNLRHSTSTTATAEDDDDEDAIEDDYELRKEKAFRLLKDCKGKYDDDHALVLVKTHNFRDGILYLYESLGLYQDILQYYMEINDKHEVINVCKRLGKETMWVQVLLYFVSLAETEDVTYEIKEALRQIDEKSLLPPLVVIDILGRSTNTKLDVVKEYVLKRLQKEMAAIAQDQDEIRKTQQLTQGYRKDIRSQQCEAQVFGLSRCSACNSALELPAVHFMCKHSYHQRCLSEVGKCQICQVDFQRTLEINRQLEDEVENHERFFQELQGHGNNANTQNRFHTVAHYFSRSIFNADYPTPPGDQMAGHANLANILGRRSRQEDFGGGDELGARQKVRSNDISGADSSWRQRSAKKESKSSRKESKYSPKESKRSPKKRGSIW